MGSIPEFSVQRSRALRPRGLWASGGKRLFDVVLSATALLVLSPLLLALALWVRLDSPGPALYRQRRVGRYGREFVIHKFRTMVSDPRGQGALFTVTGDARITRSGVWLRHTKLDELPQLFDVLRGRMSLVGPRPALFNQDDLVAMRTAAGVERLRPGVTGWAQVNGRDELPIPEKVKLDAEYLARRSFAFDLAILLATARAAVTARGVSH